MSARCIYSLAVRLLLPLTPLYLLWRARRQAEYRQHWRERFARYDTPPAACDDAIWIHAVSVGETRAAAPLIAALRERDPALRIVLTHMTPTGRETGRQLFGDTVEQRYLPYDTPGAARRFLAHVRPRAALVMETELWPNLLAACAAHGIPALLVNARLSARSAAGYARFAALSRETLTALACVGAQTAADAERLVGLGAAQVVVTGNLKFDIAPPPEASQAGAALRAGFGPRPVFVCASTRDGEEALILDAWSNYSGGGTAVDAALPLLVIVPRHPQRFDEVAVLAMASGFRVARRSAGAAVDPATQVLIGDSMGELFAYYAAADVAFVGGSLLDYGCQNLIEPCSVGVPVLLGPSTFNFAQAAQAALEAGAARPVGTAADLVDAAMALLADAPRRHAMADAGRAFVAAHRGATARTLALLDAALGER